MSNTYQHFGWQPSFFSGKTRAYFRYKGIPFEDRVAHAGILYGLVRKRLGYVVMPTVLTPAGELLQDSSDIIDEMERRFPDHGVMPRTPRQSVLNLLLECYADEWFVQAALHYRWNFPEQNELAVAEDFGRSMVPWLPLFVSKRLAGVAANKMKSYLRPMGITEKSIPGIERSTQRMLDILEAHFKNHSYFFGDRPSLADYAFNGLLWAHLGRDPYPRHQLIAPRPALRAWVDRVQAGEKAGGDWLENDEIPETLLPLLEMIFDEAMPVFISTAKKVQRWAKGKRKGQHLPRQLGKHEVVCGGISEQRAILPFNLYMLQRPLDAYAQLSATKREQLDQLVAPLGGESFLAMRPAVRVERRNYRLVLA